MRAGRYIPLAAGLALATAGVVTAAVWPDRIRHGDLHGTDSPTRTAARHDAAAPRLPIAYASAPPTAPWVGWTPGGIEVSVAPDTTPVSIGSVEFQIRIAGGSAPGSRVTVDLASPTMPMHGITRFPAARAAPGTFHSRVIIPMEGEWIVAVNVGNDLETAEVAFRVERPSDAGAESGHAHAGHEP
ncbi:MAG: hypothetical protein ACR2HZ_07715 [Gemmatimonadaceae bacterium]